MIKVENIEVFNFEGAIRGMRNPKLSYDKIDSAYGCVIDENDNVNRERVKNGDITFCDECTWCEPLCKDKPDKRRYIIGKNDLDLMHRLYVAGQPHRKYLRQIFVSMDVTAPTYVYAEIDTYKVGVTRNSCSFMHKGLSKPFEISDFSRHSDNESWEDCVWNETVKNLNILRDRWLETKDAELFEEIRCMLPSGYNQKATLTMNYENVANIIQYRSDHRLSEWREFCRILKDLPYVKEIMEGE